MTTDDSKARLYDYARQGFLALIQIVPAVLWSGVKRAVGGFFVLGFFGTLLAGGIAIYRWAAAQPLPIWLVIVSVAVVALSLSLAGAYIGGMRGLLGGLTQQLAERNLLAYLYAFVRPVLMRASRGLAESSGPITRSELVGRLRQAAGERAEVALAEAERPRSIGERLERWVALKLQLILVAAAITPSTTGRDREAAIAELEQTGIEQIEETLVDSLEGLYDTQCVLVLGAALAVSSLPYVIYALAA